MDLVASIFVSCRCQELKFLICTSSACISARRCKDISLMPPEAACLNFLSFDSPIGSNGAEFMFVLKGHEDLRQDERVMQLFGLVNTLLAGDQETSKRHLG